jgi:hypothetical protein
MVFEGPVTINDGSLLIAGGNVTFTDTIDGIGSLEIESGGAVEFYQAIGQSTPIGSFFIETAGLAIFNAGLATNGGSIQINAPILLQANVLFDTTGRGVASTGSNITLDGIMDGNYKIILNGGTSGTVLVEDAVGQNISPSLIRMRGGTIHINADMTSDGQ